MTTGLKDNSTLVSLRLFDEVFAPTLHEVERGYGNVGTYELKQWAGGDRPSVMVAKSYEDYWIPLPMGKYANRRRLKKTPKLVDRTPHNYDMTYTLWRDREYMFETFDPYPPHDLQSRATRTFRSIYGDGYSIGYGVWSANEDIALLGRLREQVAGSDFNAAVFLGEGRQTLNMIAENATRISKALTYFKHLRFADAVRVLAGSNLRQSAKPNSRERGITSKDVANRWLEFSYGARPLLNDVYGGAQFLAQSLNRGVVQSYRARLKKPLTLDLNFTGGDVGTARWFAEASTKGQLVATLSEINVPGLVGLQDPLSLGWELLPYSFVADWFIPIGSYLAARGLAQSLSGTFVKTITRREVLSVRSTGYSTVNTRMLNPAWYDSRKITVKRTVTGSLDVPLPRIKPLAEVPSWWRAANAVSLLVQKHGSNAKLTNPLTHD